MALMQWFINETRDKIREIEAKIGEDRLSEFVKQSEERFTKLEGEIRAMKARMGKKET